MIILDREGEWRSLWMSVGANIWFQRFWVGGETLIRVSALQKIKDVILVVCVSWACDDRDPEWSAFFSWVQFSPRERILGVENFFWEALYQR